MTKLHQLRYTTYSHPDMHRPSAGNLISLYGDEDSFYGPQEPIVMEVISRSESIQGAAGGFADIVLGFLGSSSDGFTFKVSLSTGELLYQSSLQTTYEDRGISLHIPTLIDGSYELVYSIASPTKKAKSARLKKDSTNVNLTISGKLGAGSIFYPTSGGTVYRIQDGPRVLFNSQGSETSTLGTSGVYINSAGNLRYEDHFPYYVFNIPNSTSANYVFRINTRPGLGLPVKQPDIILVKGFTQLPVEGETVYRDGQTNKEDPSWSFSGANTISPSRTDFTLGYVEYDIPDDLTGYVLVLVSSGLPYLPTPYRDNFSGNNYRDTERLVNARGEMRSIQGSASYEVLPLQVMTIDTSSIYDNSPELTWTLEVGDVKKPVHKSRYFTYTGSAKDVKITIGSRVYTGSGTGTVKPTLTGGTTTTQPQNVSYSAGMTSAGSIRQSQASNPWISSGISVSLFAYRESPDNAYTFDTRTIRTLIEGLPAGTILDLSPDVTYGSSANYTGTVRNNSSSPVQSGQYTVVVKFLGSNNSVVYTSTGFTLNVEPRIVEYKGGNSTQPVEYTE